MPRLSLNFFETSSVYCGDEVIFLIFHMTIGTSTQNGGRDNVRAKFTVACLKMMLPSKTRPDQASHHISALRLWRSAPVRWSFQAAWVQSYYYGSISQVASLAVFMGMDLAFWLRHGSDLRALNFRIFPWGSRHPNPP